MTYVRGIVITNAGYLKVGIGYKLAIRTRISPTNATNKTLSWSCNTPDIASVDSMGVVTGKRAGTAQICVRATDGSGVERLIDVTVENLIPVTQVEIYPDGVIEAKAGDVITHINIGNIQPSNATMMEPIWSSSDEDIATVDYRGVVTTHKDGVVQITASGVGGIASDSCTINVDSREKVTIEKDGNYNKVVFENGKVWKCINCDMIYDQDNAFNEELTQRRLFDLHDDLVNYTTYRTYTDDELRFLYTVDPCGVAKYVQMYAMQYDSLREQLAYKDGVFYMLFGKQPQYFARNKDEEWELTTDKSNLISVVSEAETLFGMHNVYDGITWQAIINLVLDLVFLGFATKLENIKDRITTSVLNFFGIDTKNNFYDQFKSSYIGMTWDWLNTLVSFYEDIKAIVDAMVVSDNFYPKFIEYYSSNDVYRVFLKLKNNETVEAVDLKNALEDLN